MTGGRNGTRGVRAFLALEIPSGVKSGLGRELEALRPRLEPARWVRTGGLHLTVKFLGETPPGRLEGLCGALAGPLSALGPVEVALGGSGFFPDARRPRVAWVGGVAKGGAGVVETVESVAGELGWRRERRPWSLHLTVARLRSPWSPASVEAFLEWGAGYREEPFLCRELVLFESDLRPEGAVYTPRHRIPLGSRGT